MALKFGQHMNAVRSNGTRVITPDTGFSKEFHGKQLHRRRGFFMIACIPDPVKYNSIIGIINSLGDLSG